MNASLAQLVRSLTANQEVLGSQARSQDFSWGGGGGGVRTSRTGTKEFTFERYTMVVPKTHRVECPT